MLVQKCIGPIRVNWLSFGVLPYSLTYIYVNSEDLDLMLISIIKLCNDQESVNIINWTFTLPHPPKNAGE